MSLGHSSAQESASIPGELVARLEVAEAGKWHMREAGHYNGGKEWFGYLFRCDEHPRLARFDRYTRKDRSVASTWRVDGEDFAGLVEAVEALNEPPRLTMLEAATLAQIGTDPTDHRQVHDYTLMSALRDKGAVAYGPPGRSRRVMSDADLFDQLSRLESNASGNPEWESVSRKVAEARAILKATTANAVGIAAGDEPNNPARKAPANER